jgi:YjjG family noncanonical pyrimidine nucleotidase
LVKYNWLLFDADGTLFDFDRAESAALQATFEQLGHPFEPAYIDVYRRINKKIWLEFEQGAISQVELRAGRFQRLFDAIGIEAQPELFSVRFLESLARRTDLIPGAEEVVRALHGRAGLAIVTNGLHEVQRPRLASSTIGRYFSHLVISEEVGAAKPDPAFFDATFLRLGGPAKEEVLVIGDSLATDIRGADNYGLDACWFNPNGQHRDPGVPVRHEIKDLRELLPLAGVA